MFIGLVGILAAGGHAGAWAFIVSVVFEISVTFASLKWGTTDVTKLDRVLLVLALIAIIPWAVTKNPLGSVILISIIDFVGMLPTVRKTYNTPSSESLPAWILAMLRNLLQLSALAVYSLTTVLYPLEIFAVEVILIAVILVRRQTGQTPIISLR